MGIILQGNRSWKNFPKKLTLKIAWVVYSALWSPIFDFVKDILYMLEQEKLQRTQEKSVLKQYAIPPWEVYLSILCISFILSPFFQKRRIKEEFGKSFWRGLLQLICSFPILSELYNFPLLLKNAINTGYHGKEIEELTDPAQITEEKVKLRKEKAYPDELTFGTTDRDYYLENIPQAFLQLRHFFNMYLTEHNSDIRGFRGFSEMSLLSKISPFLTLVAIGFTAWKKYMTRKGPQASVVVVYVVICYFKTWIFSIGFEHFGDVTLSFANVCHYLLCHCCLCLARLYTLVEYWNLDRNYHLFLALPKFFQHIIVPWPHSPFVSLLDCLRLSLRYLPLSLFV